MTLICELKATLIMLSLSSWNVINWFHIRCVIFQCQKYNLQLSCNPLSMRSVLANLYILAFYYQLFLESQTNIILSGLDSLFYYSGSSCEWKLAAPWLTAQVTQGKQVLNTTNTISSPLGVDIGASFILKETASNEKCLWKYFHEILRWMVGWFGGPFGG